MISARRATGAAFLLLLLTVARPAEAQIFSPGKLSRAHGSLDKRCAPCHGGKAGGEVTNKHCLSCHKVLRGRIAANRGYHARYRTRRCITCHTEHKGRKHALIKWPGGQRAFDHRQAGLALQGKHQRLACRKCHQPKNQRTPAVRNLPSSRRNKTFLGLSRQCSSCHADPHAATAGARCQRCHSQKSFKPVIKAAGHSKKRFPLLGTHRDLGCSSCHKPTAAGQLKFTGVSRQCQQCHRTPHQQFMGQKRKPPLACETCHTPKTWRKIAFARARHPSSIPLRGGHRRASCRKCHGATGNRKPKGTRCNSCHKDTHEQRFKGSCSKCHSSGSWRVKTTRMPKGKMTRLQLDSARLAGVPLRKVKAVTFHNKTHYPLTGKHITVACKRCHKRGRRRGQRSRIKFTKSFRRCADCHRDEHRGQFRDHMTVNARRSGQCESCHPLGGLAITSFSVKRHEQSRFPLEGAHRSVPCRRCHSKRRPKSRRFTYARRDCRACHRDLHRGRYRLASAGGGQKARATASCDTCHGQKSFRKIAFDHSKTKLPLVGRHARISCKSCHRPDSKGVTVFSKASADCGSCHADPHQGQFRLRAGKSKSRVCTDCHDASRSTFKPARFDHKKRTGFALAGKHRKLSCGRCHKKVRLSGGKQTTLYRLGRRDCRSCHQPRHGKAVALALKRQSKKTTKAAVASAVSRTVGRCENCHDPSGWRTLRRLPKKFDHAAVNYRLRGRHRAARCNACHQPGRAIDRQCSNCHTDRHAGRLGRACANCHTPTSWRPSAVLARHKRTRLPLTGWHALADCSSCHPRAREGNYRGVPTRCYGCHAKAYHDPKTHPDHQQSRFSRDCEQCHRPTGWTPAAFSRSVSGLRRIHPMQLRGKHARIACTACHTGSSTPSSRCGSCHAADRARARAPRHSAAAFGRCNNCHSDTFWRPARPPAHTSRFPLSGRHRGLACVSCHTDSTRYASYSCVGCHDRRTMAVRHSRTAGFVHDSRACRRCHPLGRK